MVSVLLLAQTYWAWTSEFPIRGWFACDNPDLISVDYFRTARRAGFASLMQGGTPDQMQKYLDMAQEAGIKLMVQQAGVYQDKDAEATIRRFKDHPALLMWYVKDEPHLRDYERYANTVKRIRKYDQQHPCYVNFNPYSPDPVSRERSIGIDDYREYLERVVSEFGLTFLSIDSYPCRVRALDGQRKFVMPTGPWYVDEYWYQNLEWARETAMRHDIPLSLFVRGTAFSCREYDHPVPTRATLRLEMYSAIAYGAQSVQCFTYYTPEPRAPLYFHDACITRDGKRGLAFDRIRRMNSEVHARYDRFAGFKSIGVWHTEPLPLGTRKMMELPSFVKRLVARGALIALLGHGDCELLMVVNRSPNDYMRLDIELEKGVKRILEDGEAISAERYGTIYRLEPGYAEMFIKKTDRRETK